MRDEVIDRLWNTVVTEGWERQKLTAERFQRIGSSNVPSLCGLRAAIQLAKRSAWSASKRGIVSGRLHAGGDDEAWRGVVDLA